MPTYSGSKSQAGRGSLFQIGSITGSGGLETFLTVGEAQSVSLGEVEWNLEDVTNFQSGTAMEWMSTVYNAGTADLKYNYLSGQYDPGQNALNGATYNGNPYDFQILLSPNPKLNQVIGDLIAFSAFVKSGQGLTIEVKNAIQGTAKLQITGQRSITAASSIAATVSASPSHTTPATLTATFSGSQGANVQGTVQFYMIPSGTSTPVAMGAPVTVASSTATESFTFPSAGTYVVYASFTPAANTVYTAAQSALLTATVS